MIPSVFRLATLSFTLLFMARFHAGKIYVSIYVTKLASQPSQNQNIALPDHYPR